MMTKGHVLVVDDDPLMVKTLTDILRLSGWQVDAASSGHGAVDATARHDFDAILMDVKMQGMDGVAALKAIRERRPDANVFLMTAYAANDLLAEAEREGVTQILSKPVNIRALLELLSESIDPKRPVLIVDTDPSFLRTLSEILVLRGFPTVTARTLEQATQLLSRERPRAVLLHLHLGMIHPEAAIAAVHGTGPSTALILYSGLPHGEDEIPRTLPREWIHAYLQKPFALDQVTGVLDAIRSR
ncbi:MAG: response regulator receiver protein [Gemmatimonadetes bacterium]|nr:response regulator receiver protein [Gemmatimonadota bacterium]